MFSLARGYADEGMTAYGTGYFDLVASAINPEASTTALAGSTEADQFAGAHR